MRRARLSLPSPSLVISGAALIIAAAGTGYAAQMQGGHQAPVAATTRSTCVSTTSLCPPALRRAVDREIGAYVRAKRAQLVGPRGRVGPRGAQGIPGLTGQAGKTGDPGAPGVGIDALFGNGSDGTQTISTATTLTRDMYYSNLTLAPGAVLDTGGFRVFVSGTLTLQSGSRISRNGIDATAASPAAGLVAGTLGGSAAGANMGLCAGASSFNSLGGAGGVGVSCPGGPVMPPAASAGGARAFDNALGALTGRTLDGTIVTGGAGGGGGSTSTGNAGSGGGVLVIAARSVVVTGSASITANGGAPAGDGGGGGGGVVVVVSATPQPGALTLSANGGGASPHTGQAGFSAWLS